jgi:heme-degrading monooxygenase HmoA
MSHPALLLLVRFRSPLSAEEIMEIARQRMPDFRAFEGLQQKYYVQDVQSGEYGGLYLWRSADDLDEYRESELGASIAAAYRVEGEPRVEVYRVLAPLRD